MRHLLERLVPAHLVHQLGTGRALDNARRDHDELARTMAAVDALARRLQPAAPTGPSTVAPRAA